METWKEDRPHKHIRAKHSIHTDRDMITCKLGREEERLNLLGDDDPDPRLDEAPTAWRERGPRTADGPAERSLIEIEEEEEEEEKAREREGEGMHSSIVCGKQEQNSRGLEECSG